MFRKTIVFVLLFYFIASLSYAADAGTAEAKPKWFYGVSIDRAQVFRDDYNLSLYRFENELSMFSFGLWGWIKGKRESKLTRLPDPLPSEASLSANIGVSKIYKFDRRWSFEETSYYIPNSPFVGGSVEIIQYIVSDRIFWRAGSDFHFGFASNNEVIYTKEPTDGIFIAPTKVSGLWCLYDLFLSVGCNLIGNTRALWGCEQRVYDYNFNYSGYRYLDPGYIYNARDQLVDRRWFWGLRWANEKLSIDLLRRIQNYETNVGGYSLIVKYFI